MTDYKVVEINPSDYNITVKDIELVNKIGVKAFQLVSFTPEYFSQKPQGEVMQSIYINESGRTVFHAYTAGEKFGEAKVVRQEQKEIGMTNAKYIYHFLLRLLEKDNYKQLEPRPGCWQAAVEYTNGTSKNFYGPFFDETTIDGIDVNEFIMNIVQIANPNLFGRIDPMLQLEQCIDNFSQLTTEENLNCIFQALQYCVYKNVMVDTMVNASAMAVANNSQANAGGFNIEMLKLEDGEHSIVAMTTPERVNSMPAAYFSMPLETLMRYTLNQEVIGLFINPGSQNFMIPMDMLKAIVDSFGVKS